MELSAAELRRIAIRKDREKSTRAARQAAYERRNIEDRRLARRLGKRVMRALERSKLANDTSLADTTKVTPVNSQTTHELPK